jgi:predicted dehydrogenase
MRDAKLVAVCDKDIDLIDGVARRFNINRRHTDFTEMLTSEELDIVDIIV